jgi:hypothetical protein
VAVVFADQECDEPIKMTYFDSVQTAQAKVNFECKQLALAYYMKYANESLPTYRF